MLTDTHAHLYSQQFDTDRHAMIQRSVDAGVNKIFLPNIDLDSIGPMHRLCDEYPDICYPMMGLHPCDVKENYRQVLAEMRSLFQHRRYIAVGETGIDLYWDKSTLEWQIESFSIQIEWAREMNLPIVIHARDSFNEIFDVMDRLHDKNLRGVFHCFTGNAQQASKVMSYGTFMMGIGGVITYDKSSLAEVVKLIPAEFLLLETDSPYLAPKPNRGKRNESAYTRLVAEKLAASLGLSFQEIAAITTANAHRMFGI